MQSKWLRLACLAAAAGLCLGSQPPARAQDANRDAALTISEARDVVDRLAKRSGGFREEFGKAVEHSMMDGGKLEDRAKKRAGDLHESSKKLRDVFNDKKDKNNPAVREQADKVLAAGADVNRVMAANRFTDKVQRDWEVLRSDLNALAQIYSLSPL
jgi:hypothetical protein